MVLGSAMNEFCQVFAGGGSPVVDGSYKKHSLPNSDIIIHHKFDSPRLFKNFVPLSTGCFDTKFHKVEVCPQMMSVIEEGIGKKGLFPSRTRFNHNGSSSYIGKRAYNSQLQPSPSEGPNEQGRWYYRNYIIPAFWPTILSYYNHLGMAAS